MIQNWGKPFLKNFIYFLPSYTPFIVYFTLSYFRLKSRGGFKNFFNLVLVKWNGELVDTESIFFGTIIGEHVKTSIGTNLNTGTVIEMGSNIVSQSFPPRYIPSFSFYYNGKISKITFEDFKDVASKAMSRRNVDFSSIEATFFDLYKKD